MSLIRLGKISAVISDELEKIVREMAFKKHEGKRGGLSEIVQDALQKYVKKNSHK